MRADQLQRAASSILALLKASDVMTVIRQCRATRGDEQQAAFARLEHAGALLMQSIETVDAAEHAVLKTTHLDSLGTPEYWQALFAEQMSDADRQAELVRLYSRVMFASNHLPSLLDLLDLSGASPDVSAYPVAQKGELALTVKLVDAGEKAADPDRVARAVDGLDMLYSACASLTQKPTMDLQLLGIRGATDRDITFLGDSEGIRAVRTVVDSIPAAVADIDPEDEIDIQELVQSLPVFDDLQTLKKLGTFEPADLQDIQDTMYQGVLLSLESGVVLVDEDVVASHASGVSDELSLRREAAAVTHVGAGANGAAVKDEYYDQYLREREKLQQDVDEGSSSDATNVHQANSDLSAAASIDSRENAIENLIKGLKG